MKPVTRSTGRSRPRNLDVSSQMELFATLPAPVPQDEVAQVEPPDQSPDLADNLESALPEAPVPQPAPTDAFEEPDLAPHETQVPDEATDFDPAEWEAMTTVTEDDPVQVPPTPEPSIEVPILSTPETPPPGSTIEAQPAPTSDKVDVPPQPAKLNGPSRLVAVQQDLADLFESDPFFNPSIAPPLPMPSGGRTPMTPEPGPTAEERLLESIVGKPADTLDAAPQETPPPFDDSPAQDRELEETPPPGQDDSEKVDEASRLVEVDEPSRLVLAKLEMELTTTREQLTREIQLRKAESVRHAAVEREWSRKALASSSGTMARDVSPAIDSPRRYPAQLVATALATLAMALGLAFLMGRSCGSGRDRTEVVAPEAPLAESTPPPAVAPPPTDPAPAPWPLLEGTGFKTSRKGNELTVRFNYGVFARGTELTGTACQDLRRIANTLTPAIGQLHLEVEGHTDASPVSAGRPYASNRELGLARAKVVVDYLSKQCGLPPDALSATSAGDANPPYANTTPESRRLNRTVVLKLTSDAGR